MGTQFTFDQHHQHHHRALQHNSRVGASLDIRQPEDDEMVMCSSGGEEDSDMPDVTEGDADMSLDLLACSAYETEVVSTSFSSLT